jgi:hypothetical protein
MAVAAMVQSKRKNVHKQEDHFAGMSEIGHTIGSANGKTCSGGGPALRSDASGKKPITVCSIYEAS